MNKKNALLLILLTTCCCSSYSQQKRDESKSTMLWKIEGNGLSAPSYMYGTFHIVCENDIRLSDTIINALLKAKEFFLEHNSRRHAEDSLENARFMKGKTLEKLVGHYYFRQIKKIIKNEYTAGDDSLNKLLPFYVQQMVIAASFNCHTTSYDWYLRRIARKNAIKLGYLENANAMDSTTNQLPLNKQTDNLINTINNIDRIKENIEGDRYLYNKKDLSAISKKALTIKNEEQALFYKVFLVRRNNNWLPAMENAMTQNSCFFAVGCAHLVGVDGLIALLLNKGYAVTPVYY